MMSGEKNRLAPIITQRGVRHPNLHLVPAKVSNVRHDHGSGATTHEHVHL
jgi:CopG family transcriptional regulator, nickel-responsive regulator